MCQTSAEWVTYITYFILAATPWGRYCGHPCTVKEETGKSLQVSQLPGALSPKLFWNALWNFLASHYTKKKPSVSWFLPLGHDSIAIREISWSYSEIWIFLLTLKNLFICYTFFFFFLLREEQWIWKNWGRVILNTMLLVLLSTFCCNALLLPGPQL